MQYVGSISMLNLALIKIKNNAKVLQFLYFVQFKFAVKIVQEEIIIFRIKRIKLGLYLI